MVVMRFASSITAAPETDRAVPDLIEPIQARMTAGMVDIVFLFCTSDFVEDLAEITDRLSDAFPHAVFLGCTAEGTIANGMEIERQPSMSLMAASLPDVLVRPFHVTQENLEAVQSPLDWERIVAVAPESRPAFVAFADPFRVDVHGFLDQLNAVYPGAPVVGGIASAASKPRENRLIVGNKIVDEGIVGISLAGRFEIRTVVSQGCRPIGKPFVVTKGDRNIIRELGGQPALAQLQDVLSKLSKDDEELAGQSLFVGRVIDEYKDGFTRGDFLIHNIIGVDKKTGAIGIAGLARVGATVQFHVRDADTADEDIHALLAPHADKGVRGAMLFGCNGRGTRMWPEPGHDASAVRSVLGEVPLAGFFCGGEFGPVGGKNFIHGFTASIALFCDGNSK